MEEQIEKELQTMNLLWEKVDALNGKALDRVLTWLISKMREKADLLEKEIQVKSAKIGNLEKQIEETAREFT